MKGPNIRKRVLIVSGLQIFPPTSGGQLRTASLAESLADKGCDVALYSFTGRKPGYQARRRSGWNSISDGVAEFVDYSRLFALGQWLAYRLRLPPLWLTFISRWWIPRGLRAEVRRADVVLIDFPYAYPVLLHCPQPGFLHSHNLEHRLWRGGVQRLVRRIESAAARVSDGVLCCSDEDFHFFEKALGSSRRLTRLANRVDPTRFTPATTERNRVRAELGVAPGEKVMLFSASSYGPNREAFHFLQRFAKDEAALLTRLGVRLLVVGSVSPCLHRVGRLIATGPVPKVEPYFAASDLAVNPVLHGAGTSLKLLEFVAAGLPLFSTTFGARGFDLHEGEDYLSFTPSTLGAVLSHALEKRGAQASLQSMAESALARLSATGDPLAKWAELL